LLLPTAPFAAIGVAFPPMTPHDRTYSATKWPSVLWAAVSGLAAAFGGAWIFDAVQDSTSEAGAPAAPRLGRQVLHMEELVRHCAPRVAPNTILAIMRTESGSNPLALHVNASLQLRRPPKTTAEAVSWSGWLITHGYSVDMGLMQINSRNLVRLKMTVADAFEPCRNIYAASIVLREQYNLAAQLHAAPADALLAAISAYNTGNFRAGFRNGYVSKVVKNARPRGATQ
jgi:type IV secretion system protein VirB1